MFVTLPDGLYLTLLVSTLLGMAGAACGAILTSRAVPVARLLPFGSGLLLGMALFLVLPEAVGELSPLVAVSACIAGGLLFAAVEGVLHHAMADPHGRMIGLLPLVLAVSLHNTLDGWNIAAAGDLPQDRRILIFLLGMGFHKLTGGFAVGAIFRGATPNPRWALRWALAAEAVTWIGGLIHYAARERFPHYWMMALLALSAGSFLYLAWHSFQTARVRSGFRTAGLTAAFGAVVIGALALLA